MQMCLVCLVFLPLLAIHTDDILSIITIGAWYGTTYGSLFIISLFSIMKFAKTITAVNSELYSLSALDCANRPGTFVQ